MNENHSASRLGPLVYLANNWISLLGVALVTTAGVAWLFTLPAQLGAGRAANPYLDIITVFGLPALFFLGLALIPIGIRLKESRTRAKGLYPSSFPPINWANPEFRRLVSFVGIMTAANVVIGGHLTYTAVAYMDSKSFCGQSCHIMTPEWTAYQFAPHSEVACVDCHVGAGARSLIEAKLNGTKQLIEVIFNNYPTPVPTPVHNLAQGRLTCGECHSDRDLGNTRKEWTFFEQDEANTATRTELLLRIGGGENTTGAHGAHMAKGALVQYRSDPKRKTIPWVRYVSPDGQETIYATADWNDAEAERFELRTMDCTDCHNRAAHSLEVASKAIDQAMAKGLIDAKLPFIKREGLEAVQAPHPDRETAAERIPTAIREFYQNQYPQVASSNRQAIEAASAELLAIYQRNIWPEFGVTWGVHPNQSGHEDFPGCFRCHDDGHVSLDAGRQAIGNSCESCHAILVDGQPVSAPGPSLTLTSARDSLPGRMTFDTKAGTAVFDHANHVQHQQGRCTDCHNALFPMALGDLRYAADLHRAAEASKASCAGCHVAGGTAFASANNCETCHTGLSAPRAAVAGGGASTAASPLPGAVRYETSLGEARFDHARHVERVDGRCVDCHNRLFPMERGDLGYAANMHRAAEAAKSSCAGCHVSGGEAFASAGNCSKCHVGLGTPQSTPVTGASGVPDVPSVTTRLGPARFDHNRHAELAKQNCQACHNKIFPLEKGLLGYKDNLHKTAEAAKTSCGACHAPGGSAFASKGNCVKCHTEPSTTERGSLLGLPDRIFYHNRLGDVEFNHDQHVSEAEGDCKACHGGLWPMEQAGLNGYADDYHRTAERQGRSCAACHSASKSAFESLNNCTRCHQGLELDFDPNRKAAFGGGPWALLLLSFAIPLSARAQTKGGYIGSDRCGVCHAEQTRGFDQDPHVLLARADRSNTEDIACETCHGPGLPHVESLDPSNLLVYAEGQPSQVNQACLQCHDGQGTQAGRFFSDHMRNGLACTSCHQMHAAPVRRLLAQPVDALCSTCHSDVSAAFNRPFRHKLHESGISCTNCHNPHGDPPPAAMTRTSANEMACLKCHGDKRGPFPFEHAPVKLEPCSTCHEPHGSSNPRLLARHNVAQLCLECHTTTVATLGGSPPSFHDLRSARFRNCTTCHSKIHGSFVSRDFLR